MKSLFPMSLALVALACASKTTEKAPATPQPETPKQTAPAVDPRYAALPEPSAARKFVPPKVDTFTTKNGIRVYYVGTTHVPLVSLQLIIPQGSATDPVGKEGLTSLTVDLLDDGAGRYSEMELSDELGKLATDFHTQVSVDQIILSMNALAENAQPSLELLSQILTKPKLGKAEFERAHERRLSEVSQRRKSPQAAMGMALSASLFGSGYAGTPLDGTEKSIKNIQLKDVKSHAAEIAKGEGLSLVVVGQLTLDEAKTLAEASLGKLGGKRTIQERPLEEISSERLAYLAPFPGATQSSLAVVKRSGSQSDPKYFPEMVLNRQIGEAFTSRINLNLREDKGFTYGASSLFRRYKKAGFFAVVTSVQTQVTEPSISEIFRELEEVCKNKPLTKLENDNAILGLLGSLPGRFEMLEETAAQIASIPLQGRPLDYFETWPLKVEGVTLADAQNAAVPYCDPKSYRVVVAGDPTIAKPSLEKLGFKVITLDAETTEDARKKPE